MDFHSPILLKSQDLSHLNDVFLENIQETTLAGVRTFHASSMVFSIVRHEHVHSPQDHNQLFYKIQYTPDDAKSIFYTSLYGTYISDLKLESSAFYHDHSFQIFQLYYFLLKKQYLHPLAHARPSAARFFSVHQSGSDNYHGFLM